jgi:hypothetical protein
MPTRKNTSKKLSLPEKKYVEETFITEGNLSGRTSSALLGSVSADNHHRLTPKNENPKRVRISPPMKRER